MKCNDFLKELTDYLDGTANAEVQTELEEHLKWCPDCCVVMNTTKKTAEIYRDNQPYELPVKLRTNPHQAIKKSAQVADKKPELLKLLNEEQKTFFEMWFGLKMELREIAVRLEISYSEAAVRLRRIIWLIRIAAQERPEPPQATA